MVEPVEVWFNDEQPDAIPVLELAELERLLRQKHAECSPEEPICVMVALPKYHVCIGLGSDPTFAEVHVEPFDGEYYTTAGDRSAPGWKDFGGCGTHTPFERSSFVPFEAALAALLEFVEHQRRSERVRWKDWGGNPV